MNCEVCDFEVKKWISKSILPQDLIVKWKINNNLVKRFNYRESTFCPNCGNSYRSRMLAKTIMKLFPNEGKCFRDWVKHSDNITIAEINSLGNLHKYLKLHSNLFYSEYLLPLTPLNLIKKIVTGAKHENIMNLSYDSNLFDIVIHSETLEHILDPKRALNECKRVLNKNGICLFTIPVIPKRKTTLVNKKMLYHSKHRKSGYLVFWDFGWDFIKNNNIKVEFSDPKNMMWIFSVKKQ